MKMKLSSDGIDHLKSFEALRLKAYKPTPKDVWTIGYGTTKGVKEGMIITKERAEELFAQDVARFEDGVNQALKVSVNENQFDALVCLAYNIGLGEFVKSTLLKMLNANDFGGAANQFPRWNKQAGQVVAGLTTRRLKEKAMFLKAALH